jgi:hypothetical protein
MEIKNTLTLERYLKIKRDHNIVHERLARLISRKEKVIYSGIDYTEYEIARCIKELDWYEAWMAANRLAIEQLLATQPRRVSDYKNHSDDRQTRDTLPASPLSNKKISIREPATTKNDDVVVRPIIVVV